MADMVKKHSPAQFQCSCCDRKGRARRAGKKAQKAREARAWKDAVRKGEA